MSRPPKLTGIVLVLAPVKRMRQRLARLLSLVRSAREQLRRRAEQAGAEYMPLTLATAKGRVFFRAGGGVVCLELLGQNRSRNKRVRGVRQYGIMPRNGLLYVPPHVCARYMEAKLHGFRALGAEGSAPDAASPERRLERGRRYGPTGRRRPLAAQDSGKGGLLWLASARDGRKLAELKLQAPPVWDGMAAAGGRLYVSCTDGRLLCLGR